MEDFIARHSENVPGFGESLDALASGLVKGFLRNGGRVFSRDLMPQKEEPAAAAVRPEFTRGFRNFPGSEKGQAGSAVPG